MVQTILVRRISVGAFAWAASGSSWVIITDYEAFVNIDAHSYFCYHGGMKALLLFCLLWASGLGPVYAQDSVTVPFQLTGNRIFVPITVNGKAPLTALFDTGSSLFMVTPSVAKDLHLVASGEARVNGLGGKVVSAVTADNVEVQVGGVTLSHLKVVVIEMGTVGVNAIIGDEVLHRFVVKIDYDARCLTLTRPDKFMYRGSGAMLPLRLHADTPAVEGAVDGIKGLFTLDTGAVGALDLFAPFVRAHDLRHKYAAGFTASTGVGLGGIMQAQSVHAGSLALGTAEVRHVETDLSADQGGASSAGDIAGNIGEAVLRQFNITFDYTHGQVILEKNRGYGRAEDGHAGLALEAQGRAWRVTEVTPGGAAAQAGIEEGERVLQIEGKDAGQLSPLALSDVFHRPVRTKVWLLLQQGQQKRLVALKLRAGST